MSDFRVLYFIEHLHGLALYQMILEQAITWTGWKMSEDGWFTVGDVDRFLQGVGFAPDLPRACIWYEPLSVGGVSVMGPASATSLWLGHNIATYSLPLQFVFVWITYPPLLYHGSRFVANNKLLSRFFLAGSPVKKAGAAGK